MMYPVVNSERFLCYGEHELEKASFMNPATASAGRVGDGRVEDVISSHLDSLLDN